ncbi:MAG TPA: SDR family NAD(P)-dependent oxidoreductase [Burkholderiaceae bacterium]|nr:SDR family NAD(P)-dependent oxidoreductase [Burkholderiaceae bacterium]
MQIDGHAALVTGGGSGLGAETARRLAQRGAKVAVLDVNATGAEAVAEEIRRGGGSAIAASCDITSTESVVAAFERARAAHGPARILMNVAGIGGARRLVSKDGTPMPLEDFKRVVDVNLFGTFNVIRLAAPEMIKLEPLADGERGVIICTASVAAFDGQIGQEAYAASKGAVVSMTLPLARDLAQFGVRAVTIAPGLFLTPLMHQLPKEVQESLAASVPFPKRLGKPEEFAHMAVAILENTMLNGEVIRLDGAIRMAPR